MGIELTECPGAEHVYGPQWELDPRREGFTGTDIITGDSTRMLKIRKPGWQKKYSDLSIETALTVRLVYTSQVEINTWIH